MAHDAFISHSSIDKSTADAICHVLEKNSIRCWIAPRDVHPGKTYATEIVDAIDECTVFLLVYSKNSNASEDVANEIQNAFKNGKTIIPYRLDDSKMSKELEYFLSRKHWIDAYPDDKVFTDLITAVRNTLGMSIVNGESAIITDGNNKSENGIVQSERKKQNDTLPTTDKPAQSQDRKVKTISANDFEVTHPSISQGDYNFEFSHTRSSQGQDIIRKNEWLYYKGLPDASYKYKLYKMRINGDELEEIANGFLSGIGIFEDFVYYTDYNRNNRLFKTDGIHNPKGFLDDSVYVFLPTQKGIYYWLRYGAGGSTSDAYLIDYNGNSLRFEHGAGNSLFYTDGNYLFYLDSETDFGLTTNTLYRIDFDGNNKIKLCDDNIGIIYGFYNDRIYFDNSDYNGNLYSVSINGGNSEFFEIAKIGDYGIHEPYVSEGYLYFTESTYSSNSSETLTIRRLSLEYMQTEDIIRINNAGQYSFAVMGNWIFTCIREKSSDVLYLCRISSDGSEFHAIAEFPFYG